MSICKKSQKCSVVAYNAGVRVAVLSMVPLIYPFSACAQSESKFDTGTGFSESKFDKRDERLEMAASKMTLLPSEKINV